MEKKWFTPAEGMAIVDPQTRTVVPAEGKWVAASNEYFIRRELDGDGTLQDQAPEGADS